MLKHSVSALNILLFVCFSCVLPPYNEELSLAMLTTQKLKEEATVGPVKISYGPDFIAGDLRFIPDKDNLEQGFLLLQREQEQPRLFFVRQDNQVFEDSVSAGAFDYDTSSERELSCLAQPVPAGAYLAHLNVQPRFWPPQYFLNIFWFDPIMPGIVNPHVDLDLFFNIDTALGGGVITPDFISADIYANPGLAFDQIYFLVRNVSIPSLYHEVGWNINQTALSAPDDIRGGSPVSLPLIGEGCFYYYDASSGAGGTGLVSQYYQGRYLNFKWDDTNLNNPELLDIPYRIEALLTGGELFCRGDKMGMVYTQEGDEIGSFPMGALRFVYELYDTASAGYRMIFVLPYSTGSYDDREIYFKVYSIATADIEELN